MVLSLQMQSVGESEQEEVEKLEEKQLNKSRCMAAPPFQKEKNIYIYIFIIYIFKKKEEKKEEKSIWMQVLPVELKVLPVGLNKKQPVAKSYR